MPLILRPVQDADCYQMVGPAILPRALLILFLKNFEIEGELQPGRLQSFTII